MATPSEFKKLTDPTIPFQSGTVALNDLAHIVDVSDTSGGAAGTSKRTTVQKIVDVVAANIDTFVPLAGTDVGAPITGQIEMQNDAVTSIYKKTELQKWQLYMPDEAIIALRNDLIEDTEGTIFLLTPDSMLASAPGVTGFRGVEYGTDYSANYTLLSLIDKGYLFKTAATTLLATAPTVDEDDQDGYVVGSRVIAQDTQIEYKCNDNSTGAAVWQAQSFNIISITYSDLVTAISNSTLVKLGWYLLTDFELTHEIPNSEGATWTSPVEPILIQAIDVNKLADYGHSQTWLGEVVYYTTDNNQSAVLGCTKGYVRRRVNNRWKLDFGTDYRNNRYRRFAVNVTNTYDGATTYAQYDVVEDGSGVVYGSLQAGNLGNALADELFWVNLGYNNGEYWGVTGTTWNIGNYTIDTDAADFEDRPMLDPTDLDSGNYFNGTIEQSADETGFNFGLNQLNNIVVKLGSTMYGFTMSSNSAMYNFTLSGNTSLYGFTLSDSSTMYGFSLSGGSLYGFTMSYSSLYDFTLSSGTSLYGFTLSGYSTMYDFTLSGNSSLYGFTLSGNSTMYGFSLSGGSLYDFTLSSGITMYGFTLSGYSTMYGFTLSGYSTMYDFTLSNSSLYGFTLSDSSLYGFTMSYSSLYGFTMSYSSLYGFTMSLQTIRKFSMEGVTVNTLDTTIATIIFGNYSKTITSRKDGAPRISYIDNSDALQIVDINI